MFKLGGREHHTTMNTQSTSTWTQLRAGVISVLVFTLCYLWMTGISDLLRLWVFIIAFAVCFVLMMQSVVDLLVWAFSLAARFSGAGVGRSVRLVRSTFSHDTNAA
jgi:hypothetical protein